MIPVKSASWHRSYLPRAPRISLEFVDAFHLEYCLRVYMAQAGEVAIPKSETKTWPDDMNVGPKRFTNALRRLHETGQVNSKKRGNEVVICLSPIPSPLFVSNQTFVDTF